MNTKEKLQKLINMLGETLRQKGSTSFIVNGLNNNKDANIIVSRQEIKNTLKKHKGLNDLNQVLTLDELLKFDRVYNGPILFDNNCLLVLLKEALNNINNLEDKLNSIKNVLNDSTEG